MNLLTIKDLTKSYTDKVLFKKADFSINEGEKIGVIGINGTGKSTLLKIIAGVEESFEGVRVCGNQVRICYLEQNPIFEQGFSIYDYVVTQNKTDENEWSIEGDAKAILNRLGFEDYTQKIETLSGGGKKRVALAAALLSDCEILVMDEPTNHLDSKTTEWLEQYLNNRKGAFVMVTHDRYFLDRVSNRMIEIDKGNIYSYQTNYSGFLERKMEREEIEQATERKRQSLLRVEWEWMKRGARARSTKQKAHIARFEALRDACAPEQQQNVDIQTVSQRLGKSTIELDHVSKSFRNKVLIWDFSYIFLKHDRVGFVGENGCGKSTLMNLITGWLEPDEGNVKIGETVSIAYFSQENECLDEQLRVIDYIKETAEYIATPDGMVTASKMLERFLFDSTLQYQKIERLSGGEKRRLYLLKILMEAPNVLVLDEPTNDLDIQTLTVLEDYLDCFDGIVITVSHDRYFLDRTVKRIFAFEGNGKIVQYEGGYTDYRKNVLEISESEFVRAEKKKNYKIREQKLKFSYKEQREWSTIEDEIADLEAGLEEIEKATVEAATDYPKLAELAVKKEEVEKQLEEKMERWMYLNELYEKIQAEK